MDERPQNLREEFDRVWKESELMLAGRAYVLCSERQDRDGTQINWEDLLSQTCLTAFLRFKTFDPNRGTLFRTWAKGIMYYVCCNMSRKIANKQKQFDDVDLVDQLVDEQCEEVTKLAISTEFWAALNKCKENLTDKAKQVLTLRYLENNSISKTAKSLGLTPAVIRTTSKQINEHLRVCLGNKGFKLPTR